MYACRFSFHLVRDVYKIISGPRLPRGLYLSPPEVLKNSVTCPSIAAAVVHKTRLSTLPSASVEEGKEPPSADVEIPDPPTNCCMSGCANCVWIEYGQELARIYRDGGKAAEGVMRAIEDPGMRIFLSLELKQLEKEAEEGL